MFDQISQRAAYFTTSGLRLYIVRYGRLRTMMRPAASNMHRPCDMLSSAVMRWRLTRHSRSMITSMVRKIAPADAQRRAVGEGSLCHGCPGVAWVNMRSQAFFMVNFG